MAAPRPPAPPPTVWIAKASSFRYLILSQDQHVLAVRNVFPFREEMKMVSLNLPDHIGHVQPDMGQRPAVGHGFLALVVLHYYQFAIRLEGFVDGRQHLVGEV